MCPGKLLARCGWRQAALALGTEADGLHGVLHLELSASPGIHPPECALKLEGVLGRRAEVHLRTEGMKCSVRLMV